LLRQANDLAVAINLQPRYVVLAITARRDQPHKERRADGDDRRAAGPAGP